MSYLSQALVPCETLQTRLEDLWQRPDTMGADEQMPLAQYLASPQNRRGIQQAIVPGRGKKRTVRLTYFQRLTESVVQENVDNPKCTASSTYGNLSSEYEMGDENLGTDEVIDIADLVNFCQDNGQYFLSRLDYHMDVLERAVATQWAEEAILLKGKWGALGMANSLFQPGNGSGQINASDAYVWQTRYSDGKPDPEAWFRLRFAFNKLGISGNALFGGGTGYSYFGATNIGCCADSGMQLDQALAQYGYGYAFDQRLVNAYASDDKVLSLVYGAIVPLVYTLSPWKDGVTPLITGGADYIHTSVFSRRLGIPMDLTIKDNCGVISINLVATTKLIAVPTDVFASNDPLFGKNGANEILITNPS